MSNGKILYNNLISEAAIGTKEDADGFGKEYIGNNNQGVVWRSKSRTGEYITMTFASPKIVKGIVVMNHNIVANDELTFMGSNNAAFNNDAQTGDVAESVPVHITGDLAGSVSTENLLAEVPGWNYRYYKLAMKDDPAEGYYQIGEIYLLGESYEFDRNYHWNYAFVREINRNATQTTSGQVYRKTRFIRKGFNLEFTGMSDMQRKRFEAISENDYICFLPKGKEGELYYGYMDFSDFTHVYENNWNSGATFMENPK